MVLLKAMRQGEGFRPEDMISLRVWIDAERVITTREADVDPILDLREQLAQRKGPSTSAGFLADLIDAHLAEVGRTVDTLEKAIDGLDAHRLTDKNHGEKACGELASCSLTIAGLLRHLSPQRVVLERLATLSYPFVADRHRVRWGEALDTLLLLLESLQSLSERIAIVSAQARRMQDRHQARLSQLLSVVAGAFLPTTFVTGLLGMNVAGIPLADHPLAFASVALACVVFATVTLYCLGRRRWWHS
jgi:zinc transporter